MKTVRFETQDQWLLARQGKITGTRLKDIIVKRGTGEKIGFYELIAERLTVSEEDFEGFVPNETPMDRGTRLQKYAIDRFCKETGKEVDESLVLWTREDNESIAVSPDGVISEAEAVETKCLSSARHVEAYLTNEIPDEYKYQTRQYFIVNDKLEKLYVCFYDPRIPCKAFFYMVIERSEVEAEIAELLSTQVEKLKKVEEAVLKMSKF